MTDSARSVATVRPFVTAILVTALAVNIAGCGNLTTRERATVLREQVLRYAKALRWGDYEGANAFIRRGEDTEKVEDVALLRKIRVTNYEILGANMGTDIEQGVSRIRLSYFHADRRIESTIIDQQTWRYDDDASAWFIDGNLPDFATGLRRERN